MNHWSVDTEKFKKNYPEKYKLWELEQAINWGLSYKPLSRRILKRYLHLLDIDHAKRKFLEYAISDISPKEYLKQLTQKNSARQI